MGFDARLMEQEVERFFILFTGTTLADRPIDSKASPFETLLPSLGTRRGFAPSALLLFYVCSSVRLFFCSSVLRLFLFCSSSVLRLSSVGLRLSSVDLHLSFFCSARPLYTRSGAPPQGHRPIVTHQFDPVKSYHPYAKGCLLDL